jgi:phosphoserine phosphatase RsbU/P
MTSKTERSGFSQRLADFEASFQQETKSRPTASPERPKVSGWRAVYESLRDLFTEGVTREGLSGLFKREARDTLRFFAREVDFASLHSLRWYKRYPKAVWKIFLAMAYRLSPPRRIVFAVAVFSFAFGFLRFLEFRGQAEVSSPFGWWLLAITLFVLLLLLELKDKLDLKGDLEIARQIQFGLVPSTPFQQGTIVIHCSMRPANTVGGDYYDIVDLGADRIGIVIADVAGKGMPAALLMALLQGSLHTLVTAGLRGTELVSKLNAYLCKSIPASSLVTLFYGELDTGNGGLRYINAGHNPPFLLRQHQAMERLIPTSLVLGVTETTTYEAEETELRVGEKLLLFTDGISEAFNVDQQEYGETRLESFLRTHSTLPQADLIQQLIADVLGFCGDARPTDDITLMSIVRQG